MKKKGGKEEPKERKAQDTQQLPIQRHAVMQTVEDILLQQTQLTSKSIYTCTLVALVRMNHINHGMHQHMENNMRQAPISLTKRSDLNPAWQKTEINNKTTLTPTDQ